MILQLRRLAGEQLNFLYLNSVWFYNWDSWVGWQGNNLTWFLVFRFYMLIWFYNWGGWQGNNSVSDVEINLDSVWFFNWEGWWEHNLTSGVFIRYRILTKDNTNMLIVTVCINGQLVAQRTTSAGEINLLQGPLQLNNWQQQLTTSSLAPGWGSYG